MPPRIKITKESILAAALEIVRKNGGEALNARAIARYLNCSTQPIFSNFSSMEDLKEQVLSRATGVYEAYIENAMQTAKELPYKASGMAYIRFAREERQIFRLLFMRDRSGEPKEDNSESLRTIIQALRERTGFSEEEAFWFHMKMWIFVHGIAVMEATSYMEWRCEDIDKLLEDEFIAMKRQSQNRISQEGKEKQ